MSGTSGTSETDTTGSDGGFDLTAIITQHGGLLYGRAKRLTSNADAAWDLLQDVYEKALRSPPREVRPERSLAWLLVVMKNLHLDRAAASRRRPHVSLELVPALAASEPDEEPGWTSFTIEQVREGLASLAPSIGNTYELHAFQGCSYAEISRRMRVPVHTVGSRIFRARAHLRKRLCRQRAQLGGDAGDVGSPVA
jgi:RNA polymerase sigma-70 factor (ECF subfamily)